MIMFSAWDFLLFFRVLGLATTRFRGWGLGLFFRVLGLGACVFSLGF